MDNTLYWLFSTIAQTYGAIIGIIGVFIVFRLEMKSRTRASIRESMLIHLENSGLVFELINSYDTKELVEYLENPKLEQDRIALEQIEGHDTHIILMYQKKLLKESHKYSEDIRNDFFNFMTFHLVLVVGCSFYFS